MNQADRAALLRRMHQGPPILRLVNVWDAAGARVVERAGFPAVATSSAGVAFSLGYPDGEVIPPGEMLAQVGRIARAVSVPVTADLEAGYRDIEATVAGMEDFQRGALLEAPAQAAKIQALRRAGGRLGVPIVINARTDIYLEQIGEPETRFARAVERLRAYRDAGADCLFVPGVRDEETIARLVEALRFPLNVLAGPGSPPAARLQELGVARVSLGSGPMRAAMALMRRVAEEYRDAGTCARMLEGTIPYAEVNEWFR